MSRRNRKYSKELKLKVIEEYKAGGISLYKLAQKYNAEYSCVRKWWYNYRDFGIESLTQPHANPCFSAELKKQAVEEYLQGGVTIKQIAAKYGILAPSTLGVWIRQYNNHEELTRSRPEGLINMIKNNKSRSTTLKERVEITLYCIQNDKNYAATARKYDVSYNQIYTWVRRYLKDGVNGLQDRRGHHKAPEELTETEKLQMENRLLKEQIKKKQMELDLLKKVSEIERR